jgi:guanine nucleotide-binding protein subunit alpha, other
MRLIHRVPFTPGEIEFYRQLVFSNLTYGLKCVLDAMDELELSYDDKNADAVKLVEDAPDIKDHDEFPPEYEEALARLWRDEAIQKTIVRGNEFALPEKSVFPLHLIDPHGAEVRSRFT